MDVRPSPSQAEIEGWVTDRAAAHLRVGRSHIDPDVPLAQYGLDSVCALALCAEIEDRFHIAVHPTLAWDYPTVALVAQFIRDTLDGSPADRDVAAR